MPLVLNFGLKLTLTVRKLPLAASLRLLCRSMLSTLDAHILGKQRLIDGEQARESRENVANAQEVEVQERSLVCVEMLLPLPRLVYLVANQLEVRYHLCACLHTKIDRVACIDPQE